MKIPRKQVRQLYKLARSNEKSDNYDQTAALVEVGDQLMNLLDQPRPVKEAPLPAGLPTDDMLWRLATWKVMRHMGYTDDEIVRAESQEQHKESGCDFDGHNWTCEDENGESPHPVADQLDSVAQILEVGLDFFRVDLPALMKH